MRFTLAYQGSRLILLDSGMVGAEGSADSIRETLENLHREATQRRNAALTEFHDAAEEQQEIMALLSHFDAAEAEAADAAFESTLRDL